VAPTPAAAAARADVVISMVSDDEASRQVWIGESGALAGARPSTVLIESSTVSPEQIEALAAAAAQRKCDCLDAPVTGTKSHAANRQLLFLMKKDLVYAQREARRYGIGLATAAAAERVFQHAIETGHGDQDFAAVVEPLRSGS